MKTTFKHLEKNQVRSLVGQFIANIEEAKVTTDRIYLGEYKPSPKHHKEFTYKGSFSISNTDLFLNVFNSDNEKELELFSLERDVYLIEDENTNSIVGLKFVARACEFECIKTIMITKYIHLRHSRRSN